MINRIFKEYFYFIDTGLLENIIIKYNSLSSDILSTLCDNYIFKVLCENNIDVSSFRNKYNAYCLEVKNNNKPCEIKLENDLNSNDMFIPNEKYSNRLVVPVYLFERLIEIK